MEEQHTHLSRLGLAVPEPVDEVLAVVSVDGVEQLLADHLPGLLHDDVVLAGLVLAVQHVVDLEPVELHHLPDLLALHPRLVVLHQQHQVSKTAQFLT